MLAGAGYVSWRIHRKVQAGVIGGSAPRAGYGAVSTTDVEMGGRKKQPGKGEICCDLKSQGGCKGSWDCPGKGPSA